MQTNPKVPLLKMKYSRDTMWIIGHFAVISATIRFGGLSKHPYPAEFPPNTCWKL
jgi:hypothetical protein